MPKITLIALVAAILSLLFLPAWAKADALSFVKTGRMKFSRYETTDVKIRSLGETAIVSGNLFRSRTLGGSLREDRWQFMKVYARRSGKWMVVAFTATEAPVLNQPSGQLHRLGWDSRRIKPVLQASPGCSRRTPP